MISEIMRRPAPHFGQRTSIHIMDASKQVCPRQVAGGGLHTPTRSALGHNLSRPSASLCSVRLGRDHYTSGDIRWPCRLAVVYAGRAAETLEQPKRIGLILGSTLCRLAWGAASEVTPVRNFVEASMAKYFEKIAKLCEHSMRHARHDVQRRQSNDSVSVCVVPSEPDMVFSLSGSARVNIP